MLLCKDCSSSDLKEESPLHQYDTGDSDKHEQCGDMDISVAPIKCPIGDCVATIGPSLVLSHYLGGHSDGYEVLCKEINTGMVRALVFCPEQMHWGKNVCLAVLVYDGKDKSTRLATEGLSVPNSMLPPLYDQFDAHLPVLIMACRTTWTNMTSAGNELSSIREQPLQNELNESLLQPPMSVPPPPPPTIPPELSLHPKQLNEDAQMIFTNENNELIVVWLASVQTTKPVYCNVTVFDQRLTSSRGKLMPVRSLSESQNPKDFALDGEDCMRITHGEINILTQNRSTDIGMDIVLHELEEK